MVLQIMRAEDLDRGVVQIARQDDKWSARQVQNPAAAVVVYGSPLVVAGLRKFYYVVILCHLQPDFSTSLE